MTRPSEIERLRSRMRQHHFVAISGPRNCGKSRICHNLKQSLEIEVRNMKEIERRYKAKAGMKWKVAYIRLNREDNPFDLLTRAIAGPRNNILVGPNEKVDPLFESSIKSALMSEDGNGLLQIYRRFLQLKQYNFLVIVDQFENLFFTTILSQEEKHQFVRLLLNASYDQRQLYVTVALRPPKADLWKQNFPRLNQAVTECRFRLYNPNQVELSSAIGISFQNEMDKILSEVGDEDLFSPEWLKKQEIYKQVAVKRIRQISEDLYELLKPKWRKMYREGSTGGARMVPSGNIKTITKQLRGIVDVIWPQLLLESNIGAVARDERDDLVDDLKEQLTDVLTSELLSKLSRLLAEELYFEREPLVQIEKHVRQLVRDWADALKEIRSAGGKRKKKVVTVTLAEQRANTVGAASFGFKVDQDGPIQDRAESAYMALRSPLDKRVAKKALTVLGRTAQMGEDVSLSLDSLSHAIGRFSSRLDDVMQVFVYAGVISAEPHEDKLSPESNLSVAESSLITKWERMHEWVFGAAAESSSTESQPAVDYVPEISMELVEDFGDKPENPEEYAARAEALYSNLQPSIRKRAAQRLLLKLIEMSPDNKPVNQEELIKSIGRFEDHIRELAEYFIRQGILRPEGGLHFADPNLPQNWERMQEWTKQLKVTSQ